MTIAPVFCVGAGLVGCTAGALSGMQHSLAWSALGGCSGFVLGIASFAVITIPYIGWIIQYEKRHPGFSGPPRFWTSLFLPLMIASLLMAAVSSWFVVEILIRWLAL
jgi:hypothetical protein